MIDGKTIESLLQELEKSGNVYLSCMKVGVDKSTYYRWLKENKSFKKQAMTAIRFGRANNCDVAEHALMLNVKDKKMDAIKYVLSHNSPKYKQKKSSDVVFTYNKKDDEAKKQEIHAEEVIDHWVEMKCRISQNLRQEFAGKELPLKPNGEKIEPMEYEQYEGYIRDCLKIKENADSKKRKEEYQKYLTEKEPSIYNPQLNHTVDSKSSMDTPPKVPPENQTTSD